MKFQDLIDYAAHLPTEVPLFFLGSPGLGKSALACAIHAAKLASNASAVLSRWELTGHGPEDIVGVPFPVDGTTKFLPPERLACLGGDVVGTLILEDITQASKAVQCACFQLVQERSVGAFELSPNVRIILTGNRANDKAGARELPSPLRNRVMLLNLEPDLEEWMHWASSKNYPGVIGAFLTYKPGFFAQTPDKGCKENGQFSTPRAWENVCRVYAPSMTFGKGDASGPLREAVSGIVGEGIAAEFCAYVKLQKELPNPKAVLDNPEKAMPNPPEAADRLHAMVTALGEYAALNQSKDKKIYLKLLLALHHVSSKGGREGCAAGVSVFQANSGDVNALCAAAEQNKKDPRVLSVLKFFAAAVK